MSLTAAPPPQEVIDGLMLDAAWERVKDLERELVRVRKTAGINYRNSVNFARRSLGLENGMAGLVEEYESNPGQFEKSMAEVMAELNRLLNDSQ